MAFFECLILGENFFGMIEGRDDPVEFYVTRYIEADDSGQARTAVLQHFEAELKSLGWASKNGIASVEETDEIDASDVPMTEPGFVFFPHAGH
ncbi:MAG: hypothetical protein IOC90_14565 [Methylocystis sp.]|nr:hypothetical protein [Methylocystis sp.]MCA3589237.1 hypothetical protein [Methylocystis sp.]MCA3593525.1 hypothetical protein [Methylocystis sp.]